MIIPSSLPATSKQVQCLNAQSIQFSVSLHTSALISFPIFQTWSQTRSFTLLVFTESSVPLSCFRTSNALSLEAMVIILTDALLVNQYFMGFEAFCFRPRENTTGSIKACSYRALLALIINDIVSIMADTSISIKVGVNWALNNCQ